MVGVMDDPQTQTAGLDEKKLHTLSGNQPLYSHDRFVALPSTPKPKPTTLNHKPATLIPKPATSLNPKP